MGKKNNIWNRDKDGNRRDQRSFLRYAIVATAIMVVFLFVKRDNVIRWVQAGFTLRKQEQKIEQYERENARLDSTINTLTNNRDSLEKFARENFNFAAKGEDVYIEE